MSTLLNRPNTALLIVDVQSGVLQGAHERDTIIANIARLIEKARREGIPAGERLLEDRSGANTD